LNAGEEGREPIERGFDVDLYLRWVGCGAVAIVVVWILTTLVRDAVMRLALRSLAIAAVITPQPLWAPGDGGYVVPAGVLLLSLTYPLFSIMNGALPILGVSAILFVIGGYIVSIRRSASSARIHDVVQAWVCIGIILPFIALVIGLPFLTFFFLGGALAYWSSFVLICMLGATAVDRQIAKGNPEAPHTTYFHAITLVLFGIAVGAVIWAVIMRIA
jgi:hypothetical protein